MYAEDAPEFPPIVDLVAPAAGVVGLLAAAGSAGGPFLLSAARLVVGAAFLGPDPDAMLLGHWYLTQPGLSRELLKELVRWTGALWPVEVALLCWPTGMVQVLSGAVDDRASGLSGWIWLVSAITTIVLVFVVIAALKERWYSAVTRRPSSPPSAPTWWLGCTGAVTRAAGAGP